MVSGTVDVSTANEKTSSSLDGVTADYQSVRNATLSEGSFITDDNVLGRAKVAVIGTDVAKKLFDRTDGLVGESIRVNGLSFKIIGVLESKGGSSFGSQDNVVLVPITTAQVNILHKDANRVDIIMKFVILPVKG